MAVSANRVLDVLDSAACRMGLARFPTWEVALQSRPVRLYAGRLSRALPQYSTHWGITPFAPSHRNIPHDMTMRFPIPDGSVDSFQAEDVFEHLELATVPRVIEEIYRVLRPGGLFRLSVPDYHFDLYRARTLRDAAGNLLFDPGGGGRLEAGRVVDGGHVWFPTIDIIRDLFAASSFASAGRVAYLHYTEADGETVMQPIDYSLGHIQRTPDHDPRVADRPRPISIVIDAWKGAPH